MKYLLSAVALTAAAAVIGIASADQAHQPPQQPSAAEIEARSAQVRRAKAAAQACGLTGALRNLKSVQYHLNPQKI